jgi:hypothetical protein
MWTCPKCHRVFEKTAQSHSCHTVSLEEHFKHKDKAKKLFDYLLRIINTKIGTGKIISLPCCVHVFGSYDFIAVLPKKDRLEIRFGLNRIIDGSRIKQSIPISTTGFKHCLDIYNEKDIDEELVKWLIESYHLKESR